MRPDGFFLFFLFNSQVQRQKCTIYLHLWCSYVCGSWVSWYGSNSIPVPCIHRFLIRFIHSFSLFFATFPCAVSLVFFFLLEPIPAVMGGIQRTPPDKLPVHLKTFLIRCDIDLFLAPLARQAIDCKNHAGQQLHASHVVQVARHGSSND